MICNGLWGQKGELLGLVNFHGHLKTNIECKTWTTAQRPLSAPLDTQNLNYIIIKSPVPQVKLIKTLLPSAASSSFRT